MKPTQRRHEYMVTVRPPSQHLNGDYLTRALCLSVLGVYEPDELPAKVSKRMIEDAVRSILANHGMEKLHWFADDMAEHDHDRDELWAWARAHVLRCFPDMTVAKEH